MTYTLTVSGVAMAIDASTRQEAIERAAERLSEAGVDWDDIEIESEEETEKEWR